MWFGVENICDCEYDVVLLWLCCLGVVVLEIDDEDLIFMYLESVVLIWNYGWFRDLFWVVG